MGAEETMNAVVMHGPRSISIEKRPKPTILEPGDAIIKVILAGICGSELHSYRGHQKTTFGHIMGHEFTGTVEDIGQEVKSVKKGERVIGLFSTACLSCWFCRRGYTNRCSNSLALGTAQIDGGQADYVRIPNADGTLVLAPEEMEDELLIMMSDIFPTGYYGAMRAISYFRESAENGSIAPTSGTSNFFEKPALSDAVFLCFGCGIVGLCGIMTAVVKGVGIVFCVDSVDDRLEEAAKLGARPLKIGRDDIRAAVMEATNGRGADACIESVGNQAALRSAFELLRPCGVLSSVGFHQGEMPFTALEGYQRNININMGRAPVRAVFEEALQLFVAHKDKFSDVVSHRLSMSDAANGYALFDTQQARKVVLKP